MESSMGVSTELSLLWAGWCTMHSVLIDPAVTSWLWRRYPWLVRWYRISYSLLSLGTFFVLCWFTLIAAGAVTYSFDWLSGVGRLVLLGLAGFLYVSGARGYDITVFLGLKQLQEGTWHTTLTESNGLSRSGAFGITRHPWYLGSILLIWAVFPWQSIAYVAIGFVLTIYIILGTLLEERKLVMEYREEYRQYQREVSMLLPCKWLRAKCRLHDVK